MPHPADLFIIRHAPSHPAGRVAGRLDLPAALPEDEILARARRRLAALAAPSRVIASPARRCLQTAAALCPEATIEQDARLWEQNFGDWEGLETTALPDLGALSREEITAFRPPGGESFLYFATRASAALAEIARAGSALIFAHAGTVRAGLGLALGSAALGVAFEVATLSATKLRALPDGQWSISFVNLSLAS